MGILNYLFGIFGARPQDYNHELVYAGRTRTYQVHLPPQYNGKTLLPVIFNIHGGGGNANAARVQTGMDATSNQNGFIVVYPEGTGPVGSKYLTWNAGTCCDYAVYNKIDDVGFFKKLIEVLPTQYKIDTSRIYVTGMSNGSMMTYRLACELSDKIAAICGVAATQGVDKPIPAKSMPIMHVHGLKDPNAPFLGGIGTNAISKIPHKAVLDVINWWLPINGASANPYISKTVDYTFNYYPSANNSPIALYMLYEGGHTWPGGLDVTAGLGTGELIESFNTNLMMWNFFKAFKRT